MFRHRMWLSLVHLCVWVCQCSCHTVVSIATCCLHELFTYWHELVTYWHEQGEKEVRRHDCRKTIFDTKCVFWLALRLQSETFLILRRTERDVITNVRMSVCCTQSALTLFFSDFSETWIFPTDFRKNSRIKFNENLSSVSRFVPSGRTDRHGKADSRFSQFCKSA